MSPTMSRRSSLLKAPGRGSIESPSESSPFIFHQSDVDASELKGLPLYISTPTQCARPRRSESFLRLFLWVCGVSVIVWFGLSTVRLSKISTVVGHATHDDKAYALPGNMSLPDYPAALIVTDRRGRAKWTVSIPPDLTFPLSPDSYAEICEQSDELSAKVAELKRHKPGKHGHGGHFDYNHIDKNFMDVEEAEIHGILPGSKSKTTCAKSLTYVLETSDAGFGQSLMGLWLSYGLAQKEGRAFFIEDGNWAYGNYSAYFAPPPKPDCLPPPPTQIVPCPHHARHLLVSAATTKWTFGHNFNEAYENPYGAGVIRQKDIFALIRAGYEDLFRLNEGDEAYVKKRKEKLANMAVSEDGKSRLGATIGVHVRHGDRHPLEFQYQKSYIPLDRYNSAADSLLSSMYEASLPHSYNLTSFQGNTTVILASDDPEVHSDSEFSGAIRAQERILLASKSHMNGGRPAGSKVDEAIGWEGGFFNALFWSLGSSPSANRRRKWRDPPPPADVMRLRELVGRTYLLDLKVLGEASDGVVCAVSSLGCRLLAVMMGWESAFERKEWRNVDGDWDWKGIVW